MIRIGIIGAGRIGRVHARSVAAHPQAKLTLIADPMIESAKEVADAYGAKATTEASDVFASEEVDAIIICSPTPLHGDHIVAAAAAGKPALCEKPLAMDSESAAEIRRRLEEQGTPNPIVMLGFNRRFDPSFAAIHKAVEEGEIGELEQLTIISRDPAAPPKEYIAVSGGIFKDMTIHDFDMVRNFLGDIKSVVAVGQNLDPELADTGDFDGVVVTLTNEKGYSATITNSRHCASGYDQRLEAFGPKGALFAENIRPTTVRRSNGEVTDAQDPYLDFFLERYEAAYSLELSAFIDAVQAGEVPTPGINDGAEALRLAEAAEESAKNKTVVTL
ncbi:MAG: inositol 2-dehydrogenase [Actinomycetaceae bacterium]|nr:inositol 2-dehydrogenase [Actinomycetaceae bacterium]